MRAVLIALLLIAAMPAPAEVVPDLWRAETIVTGTEEPERTRGFRAGLAEILVRVSGDDSLADDPRLAPLLAEPGRLVIDHEYEDRMKHLPVNDEQGTRDRPHYLRVRYDAAAIEAALAAIGVPLWAADRPVVAVWLGVVTPAAAYVVAHEGPEGTGQRWALEETAARRGLPLRLPEPGVDPALAPLLAEGRAGSPPPPDGAALSGALVPRPKGLWAIDWRYDGPGGTRRWRVEDVSFDDAIRSGLGGTARILSGRAPDRGAP